MEGKKDIRLWDYLNNGQNVIRHYLQLVLTLIQKIEPMKTIENTKKLKEFIYNKFVSNELDNDSLVQIIELSGSLLNLKTISDYAKDNNLSYNGVKNNSTSTETRIQIPPILSRGAIPICL